MIKTDSSSRFSVGVDIIEIERIEAALRRHGERFLQRVYTPKEQAYCRGRVPELAVRFAAKEAVSKALGTGMQGIVWQEMEILCNERGKPVVHLHGRARARAEELGLYEFAVSLSHSRDYAVAFVMAAGEKEV
jgi:holo-[acyl-carrier protein] synthase